GETALVEGLGGAVEHRYLAALEVEVGEGERERATAGVGGRWCGGLGGRRRGVRRRRARGGEDDPLGRAREGDARVREVQALQVDAQWLGRRGRLAREHARHADLPDAEVELLPGEREVLPLARRHLEICERELPRYDERRMLGGDRELAAERAAGEEDRRRAGGRDQPSEREAVETSGQMRGQRIELDGPVEGDRAFALAQLERDRGRRARRARQIRDRRLHNPDLERRGLEEHLGARVAP